MKKTTNSNMYAAATSSVWQSFETHLSGNEMGLWCIVSEKLLGETARKALSNSAAALGFGEAACTFVTLRAMGGDAGMGAGAADADTSASADASVQPVAPANVPTSIANAPASANTNVANADAAIDAESLFRIIEGIDPLCVVAADATAAGVLSSAYRQSVPPNAHCRLFGRDAVAFDLFEGMLQEPDSKQKAWALLKKLPRLD